MSCFIKNCKNIRRLLPVHSNISFHRFPRNEKIYEKWLRVLGKESVPWSKNHLICSDHFKSDDFVEDVDRHILKPLVVPSQKLYNEQSVHVNSSLSFQGQQPEAQPGTSSHIAKENICSSC